MGLISPPLSSNTHTEHKTHTTIFTTLHPTTPPKIIRIHVADPDATDSSGDENDTSPLKIRKYINEITIQPSSSIENNTAHVIEFMKTPLTDVENVCRKKRKVAGSSRMAKKMRKSGGKHRGVGQRPSGTWAAEIRDPMTRGNLRSDKEATIAYDHAANTLRGTHALANCSPEESNIEKPESTQCLAKEAEEVESFSGFPGSDDVFLNEDPLYDPVMSVFDPLDFSMFDFEKEWCGSTMFGGSMSEFGLWGGPTSWPTRDYFQELGDVFGSDPLLSMI
ncbi:hypothetical protein DCAR_0831764 [Daucus carota subsp. sativus]|uniref:Uncharacterized protein n=1 Tax=Daucus carota subsp. sativus TaxID=79200 RepID=A0A175YMA4_DAUCS|nr:PREDICTED: ethylene-responsive transcription factor CRF2-like [Daucus carota subsp. sativus]WOH12262.1 hypothetical protein DCAR_0831764 [Daucus carota subsp. sativus]